jgi:hypothetical protein
MLLYSILRDSLNTFCPRFLELVQVSALLFYNHVTAKLALSRTQAILSCEANFVFQQSIRTALPFDRFLPVVVPNFVSRGLLPGSSPTRLMKTLYQVPYPA